MSATAISYPTCPDDHHPHLIDLGLPSGTKWACCNVDTEHPENQRPENYGGYYAWGETETKSNYSLSTYQYYKNGSYQSIGSDIAGTEYDVAHVKWGGSWVMPSKEQLDEMRNNCTYEWTTENGVNGGKFTSNLNGVSIFLPVADGSYWSSVKLPSSASFASHLVFGSTYVSTQVIYRYFGLNVRPVVGN